jgi:SAM-dependent methyltransferase
MARTDVKRTPGELRAHYEVEKELACRLRNSRKEDRRWLYSAVYNELFQRVPRHPQLTRLDDADLIRRRIEDRLAAIQGLLSPDTVFLELGAGDCRLSLELARRARSVYALDVSDQITSTVRPPSNFSLILSDGTSVPLPPDSLTLAYSFQLMEHIHPEDALEQLRNIYRTLAPGGLYFCITPNRVAGPHDISRLYDKVATGFHLKEYTIGELNRLFKDAGFRRVRIRVGFGRWYANWPAWTARLLETLVAALPFRMRRPVAFLPGVRHLLLAASVVGQK